MSARNRSLFSSKLVWGVAAIVFGAGAHAAGANVASAIAAKNALATVVVAASQPQGSGLSLTIGLTANGDGSTCGTATSLTVDSGDPIDFCYTVTNQTSTALALSTLEDSIDGTIFADQNTPIAANGGSYVYHRTVTAGASAAYAATWTARDMPISYEPNDLATTAFVDTSAAGELLNIYGGYGGTITLPFAFSLYGAASDTLCVSANGAIVFGAPICAVQFFNLALPQPMIGAAILPQWDELVNVTVPSGISWLVQGQPGSREAIIQWHLPHRDDNQETATSPESSNFEVILREDNTLSFVYDSLTYGEPANPEWDNGGAATIGLQNADQSIVNQYSSDQALAHAAPSAIDWNRRDRSFTAQATVDLTVNSAAIAVTPAALIGGAAPGSTTPVDLPLTIRNGGTRALNWSVGSANGVATSHTLAPNGVLAAAGECTPGTPGAIIHDSGSSNDAFAVDPSQYSSFAAVDQFTPTAYPATFNTVCVAFTNPNTVPDVETLDFSVVFYDDSGDSGGPGNELGEVRARGYAPQSGVFFTNVDVSGLGLYILSGTVYIGVRYNPQDSSNVAIAIDTSDRTPLGNGYVYAGDGTPPLAFQPYLPYDPNYRSFLIRAVEQTDGCQVPSELPWLSVSPSGGTLAAGTSGTATITLDPSGLAAGTYSARVCVSSNDPAEPIVSVPVTFTISDEIFADGFDPAPAVCQQLLLDPSFEQSFSGAGPWLSQSSSGSDLCTGDYCSDTGADVAAPHTGNAWARFYADNPELGHSGLVAQQVTIPADGPRFMNFWLWASEVIGSETLQVFVDETLVATIAAPAAPETGYTQRSVDISVFADGAAHQVGLLYNKGDSLGTSIFNLDDVTLDCAAPAAH